jgi:hypothetical protein
MTQQTMQSIINANAPKGQAPQPPQQSGTPKKVSQSTASTMEKNNKMYRTPAQARALGRSTQ